MTNSALLPGEHPGIENAIAHRDDITVHHRIYGWLVDESVPPALTTAERRALVDLDWDGSHELGTAEADAMRDELLEYMEAQALSVQVRSGWYAQGTEPEPEEFRITLSVGGPTLTLEGELDRYGSPCAAQLRYSWYSQSQVLPCIESEAEALVWFACQLVVA